MYHEKGIIGFYKGLGCTYLKIIPLTGLTFTINEKLKNMMNLIQI